MESSVITDEQREKAARDLADAYTQFVAALEVCAQAQVDIVAELEKQGLEVPPVLAVMLGG